jgi:CheY-like chemotaxis protein
MVSDLLLEPQACATESQQRHTILIVDDDEVLADVLSRRLKQQGYEMITAESGAEGVSLAETRHPSLIVLDLHLPDTDGFTVCQHLVDSPQTYDIPVIVLSGMERPDIVRRCRESGSQYFVRKPYDPNALLVLIRHAIREAWEDAEV